MKGSQRQPKQHQQPSNAPGGGRAATRGTGDLRKPPRDVCLICKEAHWVRDCPTATADKKADVEWTLREKRGRQPERV